MTTKILATEISLIWAIDCPEDMDYPIQDYLQQYLQSHSLESFLDIQHLRNHLSDFAIRRGIHFDIATRTKDNRLVAVFTPDTTACELSLVELPH